MFTATPRKMALGSRIHSGRRLKGKARYTIHGSTASGMTDAPAR
jgi:hypothetical protein